MSKFYRGILVMLLMVVLTACDAMVFGQETDPEAAYAGTAHPQPEPTEQVAPKTLPQKQPIDIIVRSEIQDEKCLLLGQGFSLTLTLVAPEDWKNIDGSDTRQMFFRLVTMGNETDSVIFESEPEGMRFTLTPEGLATANFNISVELDGGNTETYKFVEFPFFRYTRRDGTSNFCVKLPETEDFQPPSKPAPGSQI